MPILELGYKRIHYTDYEPQGQVRGTVLFTHGLGSTQNYYTPIIPVLLQDNFRCITYDKTGAGRSPYTFVQQTIETLARDAMGILQILHVSKAIVVGHSMGTLEAAKLAADHPTRIIASIWLGPILPSPDAASVFEKRIAVVEREGMEAMADTIPQSATASSESPAKEGIVRSFIRELLMGQDPRGYISNCRVIASARRPDYCQVQVPVLIIAGDEDHSAPLEGCRIIYDELGSRDKDLQLLHGVGHWHCLEAPEEVAVKIRKWCHRWTASPY